jgi:hypothetical protein
MSEPVSVAGPHLTDPAVLVALTALTARAYGSRVTFDGQRFTVQATHLVARAALGATSRDILVSEITTLVLSSPNGVRSGTLTVGTAGGQLLIRYGGRHSASVGAIHEALSDAVTREPSRLLTDPRLR